MMSYASIMLRSTVADFQFVQLAQDRINLLFNTLCLYEFSVVEVSCHSFCQFLQQDFRNVKVIQFCFLK